MTFVQESDGCCVAYMGAERLDVATAERKVLHWYLGGQSLQNLHPLDRHSVLLHSSSS